MHVAVIGAGIIGVTSAYYLRRQGFDVTVIDRRPGVAHEASFGAAGVISPGHLESLAQPGMAANYLRHLFSADTPLRIEPRLSPKQWRWLLRTLWQSRAKPHQVNQRRLRRLALYSQDCLELLRQRHRIEYEQSQGLLLLYRTSPQWSQAAQRMEALNAAGVVNTALDTDACHELEPALASGTDLAGGLHLPHDEVGNCAYFTRLLKQICAGFGVQFSFDTNVLRLVRQADRITGLQLQDPITYAERTENFDAVVVAAGGDSLRLLRPQRIRIPLFPVKGYSATVAITRPEFAPMHSIIDETYQVAVTRMGNRLRISGTAQIGANNLQLRDDALGTLLRVARDWFPGAAVYHKAQFWTGFMPMLPDGPPLIGRTPVANLFLNLGHGAAGWALSCGSAAALAAIMAGETPEIDMEGLTLDRFMASAQ